MEDFHVGLSVTYSSSGRNLPHFDDVEAQTFEAVGIIFRWLVWGRATITLLLPFVAVVRL
jgi:hypothetical protein